MGWGYLKTVCRIGGRNVKYGRPGVYRKARTLPGQTADMCVPALPHTPARGYLKNYGTGFRSVDVRSFLSEPTMLPPNELFRLLLPPKVILPPISLPTGLYQPLLP